MKKNKTIYTISIFFILISPVFSETFFTNQRCQKKIIMPENSLEYRYFFLDNEVYARANKGLSDIRIIDTAGNAVPYYIQNTYSIEIKEEKIFNTKKTASEQKSSLSFHYSKYAIHKQYQEHNMVEDFQILSEQSNLSINQLVFTSKNSEFSKQVFIYGRYKKSSWNYITSDTIFIFDFYSNLTINLSKDCDYHCYRVVIINNKEGVTFSSLTVINSSKNAMISQYSKVTTLDRKEVQTNKKSILFVQNPDRLKLKTLQITAEGNYKRYYKVYAGDSETNQFFKNNGVIFTFNLTYTSTSNTSIEFDETVIQNKILKIVIENNDDRPLVIKKIDGLYIIDKIVFKAAQNNKYKLYFSDKKADSPRYDIEEFKEKIEQEKMTECTLDKAECNSPDEEDPHPDFKIVFNIAVFLLSIFLCFFLFKTLKKR